MVHIAACGASCHHRFVETLLSRSQRKEDHEFGLRERPDLVFEPLSLSFWFPLREIAVGVLRQKSLPKSRGSLL